MKHVPQDYPPVSTAHVIVGCDTESARKVYFDKESALKEAADHSYIAFFDKDGNRTDEVKVMDWQDGLEGLFFEDEF